MTVSLTFTIVNTYAPQGAKPAAPVERKTPPVAADDSGCGHKAPASRQNRFADAMMSALRELGFGGAAAPAAAATTTAAPAASTGAATPVATTAATTPTPSAPATEAAAAKESSASVESAVQQFAHALFQALRQGGGGERKGDDGDKRVEGHGHHRHHHRRHGEGQGYGDMSQRLEALSQRFGTPAAATAPASTAPAGTAAATGSSLSLTLTVADGTAVVPAAVASATPAAVTTSAAPIAALAKNPLLDAFTKLFDTLKPATTNAPATDMGEKLRQFLHTLAQALAPDTMGSVQRAQVGGLVNVTA